MRRRDSVRWLDRRIACPGPYLALCLNQPQFDAVCRKLHIQPHPFILNEHSDATAHYLEGPQGLCVVVCLRGTRGRDPIEVAGLIVHEAVHAWQEYAARIGEDRPGREQEAYAIQAISQELMAEFARQMEVR